MRSNQPLFVVNPAAGNGRARKVLNKVSAAFEGPAEVALTTGPGDAEHLAHRGALAGYAPIVGVGGDGTLQEIANGLMRLDEPPSLGIVPAGTGNDLVRSLGLPTDPARATRLAWSGVSSAIDVPVCNDRCFLNVGGVGLDTRVALAMNGRDGGFATGKAGYILQGLIELSRYENPEFTIELDGQEVATRSLLIAVANGMYFAGGMKVCPGADPADGYFDVCIGGDLTRGQALALMPAIFLGRHVNHPRVSICRAKSVRITCAQPLDVQLDGEIVAALPAEFRLRPRALRIAGRRETNHHDHKQDHDSITVGDPVSALREEMP